MTDLSMNDHQLDERASRNRLMKRIALRLGLYTLLVLFALYYLMPLFVMVVTSLKSLDEIRSGSLLSLPREIDFSSWAKAWSGACTGIQCNGLQPYFWNSVLLSIPAVAISTFWGPSMDTCWRNGVLKAQTSCLPDAVRLLHSVPSGNIAHGDHPWRIENCRHHSRLMLVHIVYGIGFTTLFFRNFYVTIPRRVGESGQGGWRWVFPHLLFNLFAGFPTHHCGYRYLAIHPKSGTISCLVCRSAKPAHNPSPLH